RQCPAPSQGVGEAEFATLSGTLDGGEAASAPEGEAQVPTCGAEDVEQDRPRGPAAGRGLGVELLVGLTRGPLRQRLAHPEEAPQEGLDLGLSDRFEVRAERDRRRPVAEPLALSDVLDDPDVEGL